MSKAARKLTRRGKKVNGIVVKVTETVNRELKAVASDIYLLLGDIVAEISKMPPKFLVDTADNLAVCGIDLSWIRENQTGTLTIMTRQEALYLDRITNKNLN